MTTVYEVKCRIPTIFSLAGFSNWKSCRFYICISLTMYKSKSICAYIKTKTKSSLYNLESHNKCRTETKKLFISYNKTTSSAFLAISRLNFG